MYAVAAPAQSDSLLVVFWNVENFFDFKDDGVSDSERSFSAAGDRHWTKKRFYAKCNAISKTLMMIADSNGRLPDAVGFAEVENSFVLRQFVSSTLLRKPGYRFIHFDSPDRRGIDCALLYNPAVLELEHATPRHLYDSSGAVIPTRDILLTRFRTRSDTSLAILVNHHPSKLGGGASDRRSIAMDTMLSLMDSLHSSGCHRLLAIGDFNDTLWPDSPTAGPGVPSSFPASETHNSSTGSKSDVSPQGTIKFNGAWEKIDGHFARGMEVEEKVWDSPLLCTPDKQFGGVKPLRTYSGPRWLGGISDHFPVVLWVHY